MTSPINVRVSARTDVGNHREHNEDNFLVADLTARTRHLPDEGGTVGKHGVVLAVCDGMGGAAAGEVASDMAVEALIANMLERATGKETTRDELAERIESVAKLASQKIHDDATANPSRNGMGTTLTAACLVDEHLLFAQVGDSRGYILRGGELTQVTRDQSLLWKLIESGALKPEDEATFEHGNIILQALGASPDVIVEMTYVELRRGDRVLLCSDGLSGLVPADEISGILGARAEPARICMELIERAKELGGDDNVTAIVAFFDGEGLSAERVPVVVRRYGPEPELLAIPDPRQLGELLRPMATGGTVVFSAMAPPEPEFVEPEPEPVMLEPMPVEPSPPPAPLPAPPVPRAPPPMAAPRVTTPTPTPPPRVVSKPSAPPVSEAMDAVRVSSAPISSAPISSAPISSQPVSSQPVSSQPEQRFSAPAGYVPSAAPSATPRSNKTWIAAAVILAVALTGGAALFALTDLRGTGGAAAATSSASAGAAGVSTWTSVESVGNAPAVVRPVEPKATQATGTRMPDPHSTTTRPDPATKPAVSAVVRPTTPPVVSAPRKGELAPIRDDPPPAPE